MSTMLYGSEVKEVFGLPAKGPHRDAVGIEIEMELRTPIPQAPLLNELTKGWTIKGDGSLRNHGYEFVSEPTAIKNLPTLLGDWDKVLSSSMLTDRIEDCPRASVHVHVNVRDYTYNQLMNILVAYTLLEGVLVAYCGKYRFGNLFALRIPEASSNFRSVLSRVKEYAPFKMNSDHRYGALNLCSVGRFGTIEFRSLGSVYDPAAIDLWVSGLHYMCQHAATHYKKPPDVYARYVEMDRRSFLEEFLGPLAKPLMARVTDIDALFEDGEEYAIRLLSSHPDNWSYEKDFRDNPEFLKAVKDNYGYRKSQILQLTLSNARSILREVKDRALDINQEGADFTDWVPAVDEAEEARANGGRITARTHDIFWIGEIPPGAFETNSRYLTYTGLMTGGANTEEQARRMVFEPGGYLTQAWLQEWSRPKPRAAQPNRSSRRAVQFASLAEAGRVTGTTSTSPGVIDWVNLAPSSTTSTSRLSDLSLPSPRWAVSEQEEQESGLEEMPDFDDEGNQL